MSILPKCIVITIEAEDGARRRSAIRQLNPLGIDFTFIDGCRPDEPAVDICYDARLNFWRMKRPLSRGEVAVYLSHRRALAAFIETDAEFALILEDDFGFVEPDGFVEEITSISRAPIRWDLIKLFDFQGPKKPRAWLDLGRVAIIEYKRPTAGMVGYLVRRSGAEKLMSRPNLFRAIDEDIKFYWEIDLHAFSVFPNMITEISDELGGSKIDLERQRLRADRSVGRSARGAVIKLGQKWRHFLYHRRYGLDAAMKAYRRGG